MKKIGKNNGLAIAATAAGIALAGAAESAETKINTIESIKKFEAGKAEAAKSLAEKLKGIDSISDLLGDVQRIAEANIVHESKNGLSESDVYLKPMQDRGPPRIPELDA